MRRFLIGVAVLGVVVVASVTGVATSGETPTSDLPQGCVWLKISHSDDITAGTRYSMGEDVDMTWLSNIAICPGTSGSIGGPELGGTLFIELVESN